MTPAPPSSPARLRRIVDELAETGFQLNGSAQWSATVLDELDYALRPVVHERRVPTFGAIIAPHTPPDSWDRTSQLTITHRPIVQLSLPTARRFADGLSSWVIRAVEPPDDAQIAVDELAVFDRPAGSERDLVVLAEALGATLVQRHPTGMVRLVGDFGVLRWDGLSWHHEPPISTWIDSLHACGDHGSPEVIETMLEFAVHDLGARGIGAILVYRPDDDESPSYEVRLPTPPALRIMTPSNLAPLRHVLSQIDGAAVFDASGTLRELGVRLVPSAAAESDVAGFRGMRHTSGRRYSFDDRRATVIVVSEDGPVTVLRQGHLLGASTTIVGATHD
jgi:hypothetical protein